MSSKIDICNMALAHLGMKAITSITAPNPASIACNEFFDPSRDDVFSESRWPFASASEPLVLSTETVLGWNYAYAYPVKAAAVWDVYNEGSVSDKEEQEFEVIFKPSSNLRIVCSDLQLAYADYTYILEDTGIYSPKFVMALSYRLAASMSHTLIGSAEVGLKLLDIYGAAISEAKRVSSREKKKKPRQTSSYQDSRG